MLKTSTQWQSKLVLSAHGLLFLGFTTTVNPKKPNNAKEIIWKKFYNFEDLQAFPIRPLFGENLGIQDIEVDANFLVNEEIHAHVAELLNRRVVS